MRNAAAAATGASTILALAVAGCFKNDEPPFNPREMGRGMRLASRERIIKEKEPIPTTMESRPSTRPSVRGTTTEGIGDEPVVRLTLQEIIQRTVANNKDVAVAGYEPAIDETRVVEAEARFDPTFFANVTYAETTNLEPSSSNVNVNPFTPTSFTDLSEQI